MGYGIKFDFGSARSDRYNSHLLMSINEFNAAKRNGNPDVAWELHNCKKTQMNDLNKRMATRVPWDRNSDLDQNSAKGTL